MKGAKQTGDRAVTAEASRPEPPLRDSSDFNCKSAAVSRGSWPWPWPEWETTAPSPPPPHTLPRPPREEACEAATLPRLRQQRPGRSPARGWTRGCTKDGFTTSNHQKSSAMNTR